MKQGSLSILIGAILCVVVVPGLGRYGAAVDAMPVQQVEATQPQTAIAPDAALEPAPADAPVVDTGLVGADAAAAAGLNTEVLRLALTAVTCAVRSGDIATPPTLTVIDYSLPSTEPRLWVFDTATGKLLFKELVAHGRNTGENMATQFSDTLNSRQSSIGLFVTTDTYVGSNGYSLRLDGLEPGFNAHARERAIVMHGAPYVNTELVRAQGRIGRSWGCPALREAVARDVIDTVRGGGVIFSYYPDAEWLRTSRFLNGCGAPADAAQTVATN